MKKFYAAFAAALLAAAFLSCARPRLEARSLSISRAQGGSVAVNAELARTAKERERGFMRRRRIPSGTGMLFLFPSDQRLSFWMKDTPSPLSIAYIDSSGAIREIFDMKPFSLASVSSSSSVRFALEVPQGWFASNGVAPGDVLSLDFDSRAE